MIKRECTYSSGVMIETHWSLHSREATKSRSTGKMSFDLDTLVYWVTSFDQTFWKEV